MDSSSFSYLTIDGLSSTTASSLILSEILSKSLYTDSSGTVYGVDNATGLLTNDGSGGLSFAKVLNTNLDLNLTADMVLASSADGDTISASSITKTILQTALASYAGASIQSRLNTIETTCYANTALMAVVTDTNGDLTTSATVSSVELSYLDGANSNIQAQINTVATLWQITGGFLQPIASNNVKVPLALTVLGNLTVDTTVFFVDSSLNRVGINTLVPLHDLEVNGTCEVSDALTVGAASEFYSSLTAESIICNTTLSAGATTLSGALAMGSNEITSTGSLSLDAVTSILLQEDNITNAEFKTVTSTFTNTTSQVFIIGATTIATIASTGLSINSGEIKSASTLQLDGVTSIVLQANNSDKITLGTATSTYANATSHVFKIGATTRTTFADSGITATTASGGSHTFQINGNNKLVFDTDTFTATAGVSLSFKIVTSEYLKLTATQTTYNSDATHRWEVATNFKGSITASDVIWDPSTTTTLKINGTSRLEVAAATSTFTNTTSQVFVVGSTTELTIASTGISVEGPAITMNRTGATAMSLEFSNTTTNCSKFIDFSGALAAHQDYRDRLIHDGGSDNGTFQLIHRGTGALNFICEDAAALNLKTTNTTRISIASGGDITINSDISMLFNNIACAGLTCDVVYEDPNFISMWMYNSAGAGWYNLNDAADRAGSAMGGNSNEIDNCAYLARYTTDTNNFAGAVHVTKSGYYLCMFSAFINNTTAGNKMVYIKKSDSDAAGPTLTIVSSLEVTASTTSKIAFQGCVSCVSGDFLYVTTTSAAGVVQAHASAADRTSHFTVIRLSV